ncbi:hypothetical protein R6Q57_000540 [Mikania cordata]
MESSSKIYGDGAEECQSSESGWTMYIDSSMDDDGGGGGDGDGGGGDGIRGGGVYDGDGGRKKGSVKDEDEDTDDSMASDASSGPNHLNLQQPWEVQEDNQEKHKGSSKKNKKTSGKKKVGHDYEESRKKDDSLVNEKRGVINTVQSGNKACFLSKRK